MHSALRDFVQHRLDEISKFGASSSSETSSSRGVVGSNAHTESKETNVLENIMEKIKYIEQGDLLTFKTVDENYRVIMCTETNKKSPQNFTFIALNYNSLDCPNVIEIRKESFWGCGTSKANYYKYSFEEQQKMWDFHPEIKPFLIGGYNLIIWRKDFLKFRGRILKIGNLKIVNNIDKNGNYGIYVSSLESLNKFFNVQIETIFKDIGQKQFKLESILKN